jgi:putative ABC transport system permease protein
MVAPRKEIAEGLGIFGALALLIASVGLFSLIAYNAATRGKEFGVRMALGATPRGILHLVLFQTVKIAMAGILVGVLISIAAARLAIHLLFGISPLDAASFSGAVLVLLAFALMAGALPAWRASRPDTALALREE